MTIEQKIPQAVPVAQGQVTTGITAINNRFDRAESAAFGFVVYPVNSTTMTMASEVYWEGCYFRATAGSPVPGGAVTLNVPAEERGIFTFYNDCGQTVSVQVSGQPATPPSIDPGDLGTLISDGVNVRTAAGASGSAPTVAAPFRMTVAVSDETTAITTGTGKLSFRMPDAVSLSEVRASLRTASSSGTVTVDVNEGGTSILSTKLTIDSGEKTSTTAAAAAVISDAAIADDAEITIDIDGAGTGAVGLKVTFIGAYTA